MIDKNFNPVTRQNQLYRALMNLCKETYSRTRTNLSEALDKLNSDYKEFEPRILRHKRGEETKLGTPKKAVAGCLWAHEV